MRKEMRFQFLLGTIGRLLLELIMRKEMRFQFLLGTIGSIREY